MNSVSYDVSFQEKASRIELLIRIVYAIIGGIVFYILSLLSIVAWLLQLIIILITGKREKKINGFIQLTLRYGVRLSSYLMFLTDERPPIVPE